MTQTHPITPPPELLAQPVAEGPSDEELDVIERQCWIPTEVCNDAGCEYLLDHRRFARAVLARWGHPTPQPVAQEEDCPGCEGTPVASNSPCAVCGRAVLAKWGHQ